jgi:sec-independent protein translocase protein TatA
MNFGNLGFMEILLILVAVLLLFGAKRLPEIGASFGKSITDFKRGLADAERAVKDEAPKDRINAPPPPAREAQPEEEAAEPRRLLK